MKLLPDTNVLVYDTIEDSTPHNQAVKIIDSADMLAIPPIVIHEYIWVMLKFSVSLKTISVKVHEYLEDPRTRYLVEQPAAIYEALKMMKEDRASPKMVNDYVILSLALKYDLSLATFDSVLKKRAMARGVNVVPQP
ncbi:MAG: PIN domain-containing protein [Nitrososphaerota archaeon]